MSFLLLRLPKKELKFQPKDSSHKAFTPSARGIRKKQD
ncbi:hypothetical protein SynA1562_01810 [Synechococcus sp. A15-62]|nr:hypothetical protein SynA1562_01810 [Synechococcus sp. A15-62]